MGTATSKIIFSSIILLFSFSVLLMMSGLVDAQTNRDRIGMTDGWKLDAKPNNDRGSSQPHDGALIVQSGSSASYGLQHGTPIPFPTLGTDNISGEVTGAERGQLAPGRASMILLGIGLIVGAQFGKRRFLKK
jgi:hypothetical protein